MLIYTIWKYFKYVDYLRSFGAIWDIHLGQPYVLIKDQYKPILTNPDQF